MASQQPEDPTQVVTFYSYKGGVGRTMALVNVAHALARDGFRVLMVDFDLEAPGMTHFFAREVKNRPSHARKDALDLLLDAKLCFDEVYEKGSYPRSLAEYVIPISLPDEWLEKPESGIPYRNGKLDLLPATLEPRREEEDEIEPPLDYLQRLDELDLPWIFSPEGPGHRFGDHVRRHFVAARFTAPGDILFTLRDPVQAAYDLVLIDSRTGLNEISGFSIGPIADALVVCSGLNQQNVEGTRFFMRKTKLFDRGRAKPFVVAAGPVPLWQTERVEARLRRMRRAFRRGPEEDSPDDEEIPGAEPEQGSLATYDLPRIVEIPYHPDAAIEETVFVARARAEPISKAYEELAGQVVAMVRPGAVEGVQRHLVALGLLRAGKAGEKLAGTYRASAEQLSWGRLGHVQKGSDLVVAPVFPTACTVACLPRKRSTLKPEDLLMVPIAAATASYRSGSDQPFRRAWELLDKFPGGRSLAARLVFFEMQVCSDRSSETLLSRIPPLDEGAPQHHRESVSREDIRMARLKAQIGSVSDGRQDLFRESDFTTAILAYWNPYTKAPKKAPRAFPPPLTSIAEALVGGVLAQAEHLVQGVQAFLNLPDSPEQILAGKAKIERVGLSLLEPEAHGAIPLGFWPEPLAATLLAVTKGQEVIREILAWLYLARAVYGYAWRVLVDWRYFDEVKEHPDFQEFLRVEDEQVEVIEAAIDQGIYPL